MGAFSAVTMGGQTVCKLEGRAKIGSLVWGLLSGTLWRPLRGSSAGPERPRERRQRSSRLRSDPAAPPTGIARVRPASSMLGTPIETGSRVLVQLFGYRGPAGA